MSRRPLVVKLPKLLASVPARQHAGMPVDPHTGVPAEGRRVRANGTRKKTVYLPDDLCTALRHHCAEADTDETKVMVAALRKFLRR
jgi:hypothetical protein